MEASSSPHFHLSLFLLQNLSTYFFPCLHFFWFCALVVCGSPKFICGSFNYQPDGIWRWGLWEVIMFRRGRESRAPMAGLGPLYKEEETRASEFALPPRLLSTMLRHRRRQPPASQEEGPHQICQ